MVKNSKRQNIVVIGPYPPPFGGVSIHIKRLMELLPDAFVFSLIDESRNIKESIFNIRSLNVVKYIGLIGKSGIVHIHSGPYLFRLLHFFAGKFLFKKIIITLHSYSRKNKSKFEFFIDRLILRSSDRVVFVSEEVASLFKVKNSLVLNAFIPPLGEIEDLPIAINDWFTKKKAEGFLILSGNAWRLEKYNDQDLYGLDLCINAVRYFKKNSLKICCIFAVSDLGGSINVSTYEKIIAENDLSDYFYLQPSSLPFIRVIQKSDMVVRPTNTDGDALTIREALFFNKLVIASDVVKRPEGTIRFKNRDIDSFISVILENSKNIAELSEKKAQMTEEMYKTIYSELYLNL